MPADTIRIMNGDPSSRASRETFLAHLHEYLVQSGCMQTANALTKEASVRLLDDVQDSFFYDWWCLLLSLHNSAGTELQSLPGLPAVNWGDADGNQKSQVNQMGQVSQVREVNPVGQVNPTNPADLDSYRLWMQQQTLKVPNNERSSVSAHSSLAPYQATPMLRPKPRPRGRLRKSLPHGEPSNKGLPILIPGVAPLVVARNTSSALTPNHGSQGRGGSSGRLSQIRSVPPPQQPSTPHWDNTELVADAFQYDMLAQQPLLQQIMGQTPGGVPPSVGHLPPRNQHQQQQQQQPDTLLADPLPQFLQHQHFLQLQHQACDSGGGHGAMTIGPTDVIGGKPTMTSVRGGGGGPQSTMGANTMMALKPDHMNELVGGNRNDTYFLDHMMGGGAMENAKLGFPTDPSLHELAFDAAPSRTGSDFPCNSNALFFAPGQTGLSRDHDFSDKARAHAGMAPTPATAGETFANPSFGLDMNPLMPFAALEDTTGGLNDGNYWVGTNYGLGDDGGDFLLDVPKTMIL